MSFQVTLPSNDMSGPSAMSSLAGPGLPGANVTNGPGAQSTSGVFAGTGMDTAFDSMHTGRHTSTMDPVSNPRKTIEAHFFLDKSMKPDDLGNMEATWMDVESGPPGVIGEKKPHVFKSWTAMNHMFKTPEGRLKWGNEQNTRWFHKQFSFVGICRHQNETAIGHASIGNTTVNQLFQTGFEVRMIDVFQACEGGGAAGCIEIGDVGYALLRKYPYYDELARLRGETKQEGFYWVLIPYWSKKYNAPPVCAYRNQGEQNTMGDAFRLFEVAQIYGGLSNPTESTAIARDYIWSPTGDGSYKPSLFKLRQLQGQVCTTN